MNENDFISIGTNRQVFIDGRFIKNSKNTDIIVHKPVKTGETNFIMEGTSHKRIGGYNSVLYADGKYKIWYVENNYLPDGIYICVKYAESDDGIMWETPDLGLAQKYNGSPNNVVLGYGAGNVSDGLGDGTCMVFLDPNDTSGRKYKMIARHALHASLGMYASFDGIRWEKEIETIIDDGRFSTKTGIFHLDSQNVVFWDNRINKYTAYVRKNYEKLGQYRTVARGESESLNRFPNVNAMPTVLQTDKHDMQVKTKNGRQPASDFYTNATIKYPWAQDAYFMFPNIYFKYGKFLSEFKNDKPRNAGPIDIRFASSRDGINWNRHNREVYVGIGCKNDFDAYSLYMLSGIVPGKDNDIYMYYMGTDIIHGWDRGDKYEKRENRILTATGFDSKRRVSAISRLVLRRDGFTSVRSDYRGGDFHTPWIIFKGDKLVVNVNTAAAGTLKVGIIGEDGKYINGFSPRDCKTIHTCNDINKTVEWEQDVSVAGIAQKPVKLYFELVDTDLYAFQFNTKTEKSPSSKLPYSRQ